MSERFAFRDKKVVITGGSSGIGKKLAKDLLGFGAHVTIVSNDILGLKRTQLELAAQADSVFAMECDISELTSVREMVAGYLLRFGAPDILVNNAGYAVYAPFDEMASEEIIRLFGVNLVGAAVVTREFLPAMMARGHGQVVMIASIAGKLPMTPCGVYSAAKHGLVAWARTLRIELKAAGVGVSVICPGRVETNFFDHDSFRKRANRKEAEFTIPIESVSNATIEAIERNRFLTYVPRYFALPVWLADTFPFPAGRLLDKLMEARVKELRAEPRENF